MDQQQTTVRGAGANLEASTHKVPVEFQQTLNATVEFSGVGVHGGQAARMRVCPAESNTGIQFCRVDLPGKPSFPADLNHALADNPYRNTALGLDAQTRVTTCEHFLAACAGIGLDNAFVELDGEECPILDGSALVFAEQLRAAGLKQQTGLRQPFYIQSPVTWREGEVQIAALPAERLTLTYFLNFEHPFRLIQQYQFELTPERFLAEIAPARTFVFRGDVEALRERGMIKGGSAEISVVLDDEGRPLFSEEHPLRFPDEMARHKILDLLGDLMLFGRPLRGHVLAARSGHAAHLQFARKLQKELLHV